MRITTAALSCLAAAVLAVAGGTAASGHSADADMPAHVFLSKGEGKGEGDPGDNDDDEDTRGGMTCCFG